MSSTFSYTFDLAPEIKITRFRTEKGDEYILTHELTWTLYGNSVLNLTVECCANSNDHLIVAELCSISVNSIKRSSLLENSRAIFNFQNVNFMTHDPWRCIIHVIPHLLLQNFQDSTIISSPLLSASGSSVKMSNLDQLSLDFQKVLNTGDLSDVVLTDGAIEIPAHKVILAARSPVFSRMFEHQMKENCENCVLISDITGKELKELVSFIYTGVVSMTDAKMARDLYMAADKYAIKDLKSQCSEVLRNVKLDDVLDTLELADLHEDKELKRASLEFISKNYTLVKGAKNWERFTKENQPLAIEILSFVLENKSWIEM